MMSIAYQSAAVYLFWATGKLSCLSLIALHPSLSICRRVNRSRELCHIRAFEGADFADAAFSHLVDPEDRMQRKISAFHALEFRFHFLLGWVDHHGGAFPEHQFLHLYKSEQRSMADLSGVNFVDLPLIDEHDLKNVTGGHIGA